MPYDAGCLKWELRVTAKIRMLYLDLKKEKNKSISMFSLGISPLIEEWILFTYLLMFLTVSQQMNCDYIT